MDFFILCLKPEKTIVHPELCLNFPAALIALIKDTAPPYRPCLTCVLTYSIITMPALLQLELVDFHQTEMLSLR